MKDHNKKYDASHESTSAHIKPHPIRFNQEGHIHFITTSCYHRKPFFSKPWTRKIVIDAIDQTRIKKKFLFIGYVIMPEHVHFLVVPNLGETISNTVKSIKWNTSICLLRELRKRGMEEKILWQSRFYDFNIITQKKLYEKLEYCHKNPVTRNLVQSPGEWIHSSYLNYENNDDGVIRIDRWWDYWKDSWI